MSIWKAKKYMRASQRAQVERHMKRCGGAAEVAVWLPLPGAAPSSLIENRSRFKNLSSNPQLTAESPMYPSDMTDAQ